MGDFTHLNEEGEAIMVDVHEKDSTFREARAAGVIRMSEEAFHAVSEGTVTKGDVLAVARVAGITGAKRCADLIPLCHNIPLTDCGIEFALDPENTYIHAECHVSCIGRTGVEMEALTGVSVALLTIYDMCKAIDRGMIISGVHLIEKSGGKSGNYHV